MQLRTPHTLVLATLTASALGACGGGGISYRHVDTPAQQVLEYGGPSNTEYALELEPAKEQLGITVYEHSLCDKINVQLVHRTRETLEGDRVISETPLGKVQVAQRVEGQVPCEQRFAREALVSLKVGGAVYRVGKTDAEGRVGVNLAKHLDADVYGAPQTDVIVLVRGQGSTQTQEAGHLKLDELRQREARVEQLISDLSSLLAKEPGQLTAEDLTRSYQLYAQLRSVAWYDARFEGLKLRFWEVWQNRKDLEATENLGRNLKALEGSKELLRTSSAATLPLFAQVGISSGVISGRMLEWARWQVLDGLKNNARACQTGFSWTGMPDFFSVEQQIAGGYLHYAYGDPYAQTIDGMCGRLGRLR